MPNFINPYYGPTYPSVSYSTYPQYPMVQQIPQQQSYAQPPMQQKGIEWVEGEIGAKAYQIPAGWPANTPIPLWDSTDTVIYLKSVNQVGMPNPMQKLKYSIEEAPQQALLSGATGTEQDVSQYVTKQDLEQLRQEIRQLRNNGSTQNGSNSTQTGNGGARGGNR